MIAMSHDRNFELHLLYQEDDGVKPTRRRVTAHRRVSFLPRLLARGYLFVGAFRGRRLSLAPSVGWPESRPGKIEPALGI